MNRAFCHAIGPVRWICALTIAAVGSGCTINFDDLTAEGEINTGDIGNNQGDRDERASGGEGGPCYGNGTCDGDLVCASGVCVALEDSDEPSEDGSSSGGGGGGNQGGDPGGGSGGGPGDGPGDDGPQDSCDVVDSDGDGVGDACDNCPIRFNASQDDQNADGIGNACDCRDDNYAQGGVLDVDGTCSPVCSLGSVPDGSGGCVTSGDDSLSGIPATLAITADNGYEVYLNGQFVGRSTFDWVLADLWQVNLVEGENTIAVRGIDAGGPGAVIVDVRMVGLNVVSNTSWKVSATESDGWADPGFDDSSWSQAVSYGGTDAESWWNRDQPGWQYTLENSGFPVDSTARWIWSARPDIDDVVFLRKTFATDGSDAEEPDDGPSSCGAQLCGVVGGSTCGVCSDTETCTQEGICQLTAAAPGQTFSGSPLSGNISGTNGDDRFVGAGTNQAMNDLVVIDTQGQTEIEATNRIDLPRSSFDPTYISDSILNSRFILGDGFISIRSFINQGYYASAVRDSEFELGSGNSVAFFEALDGDWGTQSYGTFQYGLTAFATTQYNAGAGRDRLSIVADYNTPDFGLLAVQQSSIFLGEGPDELLVEARNELPTPGTTALDRSSVAAGEGPDTVDIRSGYVGLNESAIDAGSGDDTVSVRVWQTALLNSTVVLGTGNDRLELATASPTGMDLDGTSEIDCGAGDDVVILRRGKGKITGGSGFDELVLLGASSDFEVQTTASGDLRIVRAGDFFFELLLTGVETVTYFDDTDS